MVSQVHLLRDLRAAPVAAVRERPVRRDDQADRAGLRGPARSAAAIASRPPEPVDLEEQSSGWRRRPPRSACWRTSDRPIAVPRAAAARATATSPSGCTACTPVGEMITGSEISCPITVVDRSRLSSAPTTCGAKPSSPNASTLSATVRPFSLAGDQRGVDRLGQPLLRAPLRDGDRLEPGITGHG